MHTEAGSGAPPTRGVVAEPEPVVGPPILVGASTFLAVSAVAVMSSWLVLSHQVALHSGVPFGDDVPSHLWRSRIVHALGLRSLFGASPFEFHANSVNPDRIGLPALGSLLGATVHVGPWRLMFVASALAAAALAFSAWAIARAANEPRWAAPIYAAVVAWSIPFAITARGSHLDNALADAMIVALAAVVIRLARGEAGIVAGVALAVGALLMHWPVGLMFVAVLGLYALALIPSSLAARQRGDAWLTTPSVRVGVVAAISAGLGFGALAWTPGAQAFATAGRASFAYNVRRLLHYYRLPIALPLAAGGAVLLWFQDPRAPHRRALLFYAAWMVPILGGTVLFAVGRSIPVMRFVAVALPVPLLAAAAGVGLIRLATRQRFITGRALPVVIAAVALVVIVGTGAQGLDARRGLDGSGPMASPSAVQAIRTAVRYLTTTAPGQQAVFVVRKGGLVGGDFGMVSAFRRIRAFAPGAETSRIATYLGDPGELLAGRATHDATIPGFDATSDLYWGALRDWLRPDPVVMVLRAYDDHYHALARDNPGAEIAPGVMVLRGPPPSAGFRPPAALRPPGTGALVAWTAAAFAVLMVAGLGWAWGCAQLAWDERLALTPALGLTVLVLAAFVVGMSGISLAATSGRVVVVGAALAGWAALPLRRGLARARSARRAAKAT